MNIENAITNLQENWARMYRVKIDQLLCNVDKSFPLTESCRDMFYQFLEVATIPEMEELHTKICTLVRGVNHPKDPRMEGVVDGLTKLMVDLVYELAAKDLIKEAEARAAERCKPFGLALPIVHKRKRWYKRLIRWIKKRLRSK